MMCIMVRRNCPNCREWLRAVNKINLKLPLNKQIKVIDCWEQEELGINDTGLMKKFDREGFGEEGYPFVYLDGMIVEPASSIQLEKFLESFLKKEFLFKFERY